MNIETRLAGQSEPGWAGAAQPHWAARDKRAVLYALSLLADVIALVLGYLVATHLRPAENLNIGAHSIIAVALPVFVMFAIAREVQSVDSLESRSVAINRALGALGATALIMLGGIFLFDVDTFSRVGFLVTFATAALLIIAFKVVLDSVATRWLGREATSTILVLDDLEVPRDLAHSVVDVAALQLSPCLQHPARMDALSRIIAPYDRVVVACTYEKRANWAMFLRSHDVGGEIILDRDLLHGAVAIGEYATNDTIVLSRGPLSLAARIQKRIFDLVVAGLAIVALGPLLLLIAAAIKIDSPGPVLFRQARVGQGNRQFSIFKFRSMRVEQLDAAGHVSTRRDDDRITRVGRFIRKTSLDELPQLFNVVLGHMSIVGPRPHALGSHAGDALFWEATNQYWLRHALKPGITGLAQVRGFRGATERVEDLQARVRADLEYLASWSLMNDIIIMLRTLRVVVHKNAF
ncbi:exopolysaccharide biosynthesis polyprenyl glycosylphosphotransferase [Qipengyuania thermophila]|uniref:exopolysaccharide biosynthesis polyprenyl glycosylphosphotransferase n=1 Tax=Qipengyuania thermophila TaxID=2509361 RepID=UPI001020DE43|nr:exopolysaccharide biosynthesis polyprenyl glycosylphosphotransferase [Qipengyuania thermophila]